MKEEEYLKLEIKHYRKIHLSYEEIRELFNLPAYGWNDSHELNLYYNIRAFMTASSKDSNKLEVWRRNFNEREVMDKLFHLKNEKLVEIEYEAFGNYNFIFETTKENIDLIDERIKKIKRGWWIFKDDDSAKCISYKYNQILNGIPLIKKKFKFTEFLSDPINLLMMIYILATWISTII